MALNSQVPISLRCSIDPNALCRESPCDLVRVLGSFWPNSRTSFESHVVKSFKECNPTGGFEPHISALCEFYSRLILEAVKGAEFDWVARVLSSAEKEPDRSRPQSLLTDIICRQTGARDLTYLFRKSESRPSMRSVDRLSGPDALHNRVHYVVQDLFIKPSHSGGSALLIDDIYNTGASMRVYAVALKEHARIERVYGVNLAATRFHGGRDGHGMLKLDTSGLDDNPGLHRVLVDSAGFFHLLDDCPSAQHPLRPEMRFVAERQAVPCGTCCLDPKPRRKWWQIWR